MKILLLLFAIAFAGMFTAPLFAMQDPCANNAVMKDAIERAIFSSLTDATIFAHERDSIVKQVDGRDDVWYVEYKVRVVTTELLGSCD